MSGYSTEAVDAHLAGKNKEIELLRKPLTGAALALRIRKALDSQPSALPATGIIPLSG